MYNTRTFKQLVTETLETYKEAFKKMAHPTREAFKTKWTKEDEVTHCCQDCGKFEGLCMDQRARKKTFVNVVLARREQEGLNVLTMENGCEYFEPVDMSIYEG